MMMQNRTDRARQVLEICDRIGITVMPRPVLRPADKVTPPLEAAAREVADELLHLVLERERVVAGQEHMQRGIPCRHCNGTGFEPTALMLFEQLRYTLLALMWDVARVERLRTELKSNEVLANMPRQGGIDLVDSKGNQRTLRRYDS